MNKLTQTLYCIGLGGVGVSAVAKIYLQRGWRVVGSDPNRSRFVDELITLGAIWYPDEDPSRMAAGFDLVVYTDDAPPDHPLRQAAVAASIRCENFSTTLGRLLDEYPQRVAVAGTNGKSTTTALTGLLLADGGLDPTVEVGSWVPDFAGNVRLGQGEVMVVEADEYHDHFHNLRPNIVVVTNIELDHVEYFHDLQTVTKSFQDFIDQLPNDGVLIINGDDPATSATFGHDHRAVSFGHGDTATLRVSDIILSSGAQQFHLHWHGRDLGTFVLHRPGEYNLANALGAIAVALMLDVDPTSIRQTVERFSGIARRFEILTPTSGVTVVNDYAHHPTAVQVTLDGAKTFFPGRRIVAIFQPHHRQRLAALYTDFLESFSSADAVMMLETFVVRGRDIDSPSGRSAKDLATELASGGQPVHYVATMTEAEALLPSIIQPHDVLIFMGAGDIWKLAQHIAAHYV